MKARRQHDGTRQSTVFVGMDWQVNSQIPEVTDRAISGIEAYRGPS